MGRKLDLSGLTDTEAEHVLEVVKRDMKLRKKEEERLSELRQELDEEGSRCLLLSRQSRFNQRCCIRCCSPFTFLLNPKRTCSDCRYNVCKACRVYIKRDGAWLCTSCQKSRLLKTQSLEWFYNNVKSRFKRFGSAKVLKTLYRKHLLEHSTLTELTEGSAYEESVYNEGSVCGSDSAFYRQTEEHSMAETLTVALRVAEEAIDEAIGKAEFENTSQERQNEAHYLRQHRGELIEELAKTIVQKIISRRKTLTEMREEYEQDRHSPDHMSHQHHHHHHHQSACQDQASSSLNQQTGLWRSHSAFSLLDNDPAGLIQDSAHTLKREGSGSAMSTWKSVDRLDNAGVSSVLTSPDGNWIALQSAQLSRPSLLTKRKSPVYSALERESAVVSAYEDMGSDNENKNESDSCWGAGLQEFQKKMTDSNLNQQVDDEVSVTGPGSRHDWVRDPEGNWESRKPLLALLKRSMSADTRMTSLSSKCHTVDVNCEVEGAEEEEKRRSQEELLPSELDCDQKGSQTQQSSGAATPDTLLTSSPDLFDLDSEVAVKKQQVADCDSSSSEGELDGARESGGGVKMDGGGEGGTEEEDDEIDESPLGTEVNLEDEEEERDTEEEEVRDRLCKLVAQARLSYFASTDDELDKVGLTEAEPECGKDAMEEQEAEEEEEEEEEDEDEEEEEEEDEVEKLKKRKLSHEQIGDLPFRICQLEREVRASQFSSTEDELDRAGAEDDEARTQEGQDGDGVREELAVKVCRLASQVNATQFSSTEDELDRAGRSEEEEEEAMDEETLWKLQAEKAVQAAQLRDLSCLVTPSQFSSCEGLEMDQETECQNDVGPEGWDRTESLEDLDVGMFDLGAETEESSKERGDEKVTARVLHSQKKPGMLEDDKEEMKVGEESEGQSLEETVCRDTKRVKEMENDSIMCEAHGDKEPDREEAEATQEDVCDGKENPDSTAGDSDDEDEEFNRIISSMLMMTLEDMQGAVFDGDNTEDAGEQDRAAMDEEVWAEWRPGGQITNIPEGAGSSEPSKSQGQSELAAEQRSIEDEGERESRDLHGKGQSDRNRSKEEEEEQERHLAGEAAQLTDGQEEPGGGRDGGCQEDRGPGKAPVDGGDDICRGEDEERRPAEESGTSHREGLLSPQEIHISSEMELYKTLELIHTLLQQRHSAVSLCNITTEVLKVLNATEELLHGVGGGSALSASTQPPNTDPRKLDQQFSKLEENVYVAAGTVYSLEAELNDLEECARGVSSATSDMELSYLEEQVASAAGKVKQSELQVSDISARIAALKNAGLDVDPQSRVSRTRATPVTAVTLDASRQQRRRLPAPPFRAGQKEN